MTTGIPEKVSCTVSVLVFTLDEELNLEHCLGSLEWCDDVIVVDSFSTDRTLDICTERGIRYVQHAFSGFGDQRNWALQETALKHDWVLILDADERVPADLAYELNCLAKAASDRIAAYRLKRRFHMWGKWLRYSSLYPSWVVRFVRRGRVRFVNRGHAETQEIEGDIGEATGYLIDENHKPLEAWYERQCRYAHQEALYELADERSPKRFSDFFSTDPLRRRASLKRLAGRLPCRGLLYFLYCYILRFGFMDGADGLRFCRMKAMYQAMIAVNKRDFRMRHDAEEPLEKAGTDR